MTKSIFYIFSFLALLTSQGVANATSPKDSSKAFKEECVKILQEMKPSLEGRTSQGNNYSLFAIKRGKEWTFLILDSTGYYSVRQAKKQEEVTENPQTYTDMLVLMGKAKFLRVKTKPKNISGLTIANYYIFKPSGKKMYRSFVRIQGKIKFFDKNVKTPGGIGKILKRSLK